MKKIYLPNRIAVEAIQWNGENLDEIKAFCGKDAFDWSALAFTNTVVGVTLVGHYEREYMHVTDYIYRDFYKQLHIMDARRFEGLYREI